MDEQDKTKTIADPLEQVFDIAPATTVIDSNEVAAIPPVDDATYSEKDKEIDGQFQTVHELALNSFESLTDSIQIVDSKLKARLEETAVLYLNTALEAAKAKSAHKLGKDKLAVSDKKAQTPNTLNQNVIIEDRNNILKTLFNKKQDS